MHIEHCHYAVPPLSNLRPNCLSCKGFPFSTSLHSPVALSVSTLSYCQHDDSSHYNGDPAARSNLWPMERGMGVMSQCRKHGVSSLVEVHTGYLPMDICGATLFVLDGILQHLERSYPLLITVFWAIASAHSQVLGTSRYA